MNILIVGSGGREHALAWKVAQSPRCSRLWIAPGNAGTASLGENVPVHPEDVDGLVRFSREHGVDLVIVGPEASLSVGLADALQKTGIRVFGPTQAAAQIETSKVFSKHFMDRRGIPTARFATFSDFEQASRYITAAEFPLVIKTSGLAAGKGVILPETKEDARQALQSIMLDGAFGSAGQEVVIEERLEGEEVSLLAFTDGITVRVMPPAQDHKRLLDGDQGPNTGGMGAYAPAPACPEATAESIARAVLQPAVDGLRSEGHPFVGVLYAGLMLTAQGPYVLEYNCRFGDPETQALLPLLESDLVDIAVACAEQRLDQVDVHWSQGSAAVVVLASEGYPGKVALGRSIEGLEKPLDHAIIFHAGTRTAGESILTSGGRVLGVTGTGPSIREALAHAYEAVDSIHFDGMQFRRDIGHRALERSEQLEQKSAYAASGVDIDAGNRAVDLMRDAVKSTYSPAVLAGIGSFGGLFDASVLKSMRQPVLVASTDGVGTKVRLAAASGKYESIGKDIVNHCIDDILVQGARPLFFLDYLASAKLQPEVAASLVCGMAEACRDAGCVLLGGETAEMPGVYGSGEFDVAGTIVGVVEREQILPRADLCAGDLLVGLASSGPHTNGYSLIRQVFQGMPLETYVPEIGGTLADVLLAPHRSYLAALMPVLTLQPSPVKALAHLTGGGFLENIPRVLPDNLSAVIDAGSWPVLPVFSLIQARGNIPAAEMYRVFNMGIGMVAVVAPEDLPMFQDTLTEESWVIGRLVAGKKGVQIQ